MSKRQTNETFDDCPFYAYTPTPFTQLPRLIATITKFGWGEAYFDLSSVLRVLARLDMSGEVTLGYKVGINRYRKAYEGHTHAGVTVALYRKLAMIGFISTDEIEVSAFISFTLYLNSG